MRQDKYCPLSANTDGIFCSPACAWYTDAGCAIMVLATRQYKMEVEYDLSASDDDGYDLPL